MQDYDEKWCLGEGGEREVGEEVKKGRVERESGEGGFPLVPFLRRMNQIPTPRSPHSIPAKIDEVLHCTLYMYMIHLHVYTYVCTHTVYIQCIYMISIQSGAVPGIFPLSAV